jgi:ribonucleoside-diphosphate reductase alpha chain
MDYLFRRLALEYLTYDERAELGIFSVDERLQPTLPGVDEAAMQTNQGHDLVADPKSIPSASELAVQMTMPAPAPARQKPVVQKPVVQKHSDAPMCMQCGVQMNRAGSCHACPSCGNTSGCS